MFGAYPFLTNLMITNKNHLYPTTNDLAKCITTDRHATPEYLNPLRTTILRDPPFVMHELLHLAQNH